MLNDYSLRQFVSQRKHPHGHILDCVAVRG